ncbi:MAG: OmpA family protein [Desulfocapsaceae bacterium]|nr:OmpA family protein [Desulfocapsaceae bacterium]
MGRKKEEHEKEPNHERWLVSYADFITLLFAVFVTLYAMSQVDKAKVAKVIASTNEAFGVSKSTSAPAFQVIDTSALIPLPNLPQKAATDTRPSGGDKYKSKKKPDQKDLVDEAFKPPDLAPVKDENAKPKEGAAPDVNAPGDTAAEKQLEEKKAQGQEQARPHEAAHEKVKADLQEFQKIKENIAAFLKAEGAQDKVKMDIGPRGLVISLKDTEFFDSGKASVRQDSKVLLDNIAAAIGTYSNSIRIEGHTDNIPIKTAQFPSNWELSTARATNIVHYLIDDHQYSADKLSAVGYGQYRPIADNSTEEGRQKNRRVDVVVLSSAGEQGEPGANGTQPEK